MSYFRVDLAGAHRNRYLEVMVAPESNGDALLEFVLVEDQSIVKRATLPLSFVLDTWPILHALLKAASLVREENP